MLRRPSLLSEAPVFLALHDALIDLGDMESARAAIARGIPHLVTRVRALAATEYVRSFLTEIPSNAGLISAADAYGLLPRDLVV